ncbi:MAG: hypothetical protein AAGI17_08940 [Planctomycetota bacterium]
MRAKAVVLALVTALTPLAGAQDDFNPDTQAAEDVETLKEIWTPEWTLRLEPSVYFVGIAGDLELPGSESQSVSPGRFEIDTLNLQEPRLEPFGEAHYQKGRLRLSASGFSFSSERTATIGSGPTGSPITAIGGAPIFGGERVTTDFRFVSAELELGYRVLGDKAGFDNDFAYGLDLFGGVRFHSLSIDASVEATAGARTGSEPLTTDADELFAEPIIGARLELDFDQTYGLDVASSVGGFGAGDRSSFSYDILVGFWYRPRPWVGVQIGYRLLLVRLESGEGSETFEWEGNTAGLYWGVTLSF